MNALLVLYDGRDEFTILISQFANIKMELFGVGEWIISKQLLWGAFTLSTLFQIEEFLLCTNTC